MPRSGRSADWSAAPAYVWDGAAAHPVMRIEAPRLELLRGIERQKAVAAERAAPRPRARRARHPAVGARGMGKSALIRSAVVEAQATEPGCIALVQVATDAVASLSALFAALAKADRRFLRVRRRSRLRGRRRDGAAPLAQLARRRCRGQARQCPARGPSNRRSDRRIAKLLRPGDESSGR